MSLTVLSHTEILCFALVLSDLWLLESSCLSFPQWFLSLVVITWCDMVIPFITENIYSLHNDQLINSFLLVQKLFKFHKVKIVHCCIYSWMTGALFRKSLPNTEVYFLLFLLEVLDLSLRSMIHLALICVQVESEESIFLLYVHS